MLSSSVHHQPLLNLGLSSGGSETRKFIPDLEDPRVWRGRKRGRGVAVQGTACHSTAVRA